MKRLSIAALITFLLDQGVKAVVINAMGLKWRGAIDVVPPFLNLRMAWNRGINFGLLANQAEVMRWLLVVVAVLVSAGVVVWVRRAHLRPLAQIAAGMLVGGALGNALDRLIYGAVADFINMSCCGIENPYAFNIADVGVFAGAIGLILFSGRGKTA